MSLMMLKRHLAHSARPSRKGSEPSLRLAQLSKVSRRGFFRPVSSLFRTSRRTRAASSPSCSWRYDLVESGSIAAISRRAQDIALTTMSSRSETRISQTARVRTGSPKPPFDLELRATVLTKAARLHHRSSE